MHHRNGRAVGRHNDVDVLMYLAQRCFKDVHGERRGSDGDVPRSPAHSIRPHHARPGITLGRRHPAARTKLPARIEKRRAVRCQRSGRLPCTQNARQDIRNVPRERFHRCKASEGLQHTAVIGAALRINGEHAGRIADAEHPLSRELPMYIASERSEKPDFSDMLFARQDGI